MDKHCTEDQTVLCTGCKKKKECHSEMGAEFLSSLASASDKDKLTAITERLLWSTIAMAWFIKGQDKPMDDFPRADSATYRDFLKSQHYASTQTLLALKEWLKKNADVDLDRDPFQ